MLLNNFFNPDISKYYFFYLKIYFILYLIISSIIVKNTKFIINHTYNFYLELLFSFIFMSIIPIFIMSYFRNYSIFNSFILKRIFLFGILFCFIHIMFEINGFYSFFYDHNESFIEKFYLYINNNIKLDKMNIEHLNNNNNDDCKNNFFKNHLLSLLIVLFISFILIILYIIFTGFITGIYKDDYGLSYKMLFFEGLLIGFFSIFPVLFFAYNRSNKKIINHSLVETILLCIKYIILHYILHYSGFYLLPNMSTRYFSN